MTLFKTVLMVCLALLLPYQSSLASGVAHKKHNTERIAIGQTVFGFELVKQKRIPELDVNALLFMHKQTGAQLLKLEADDDNKTFSIAFKTPVSDDTGLPHILEHAVLNGSRKFQVKSPFFIMAKGSLNTFLNAMTSTVFTVYPFASRNKKDFANLMDVYLDAVFYPRIHQEKRILLQEGWHYELADPKGELTYNGVVYNEMKGAFSSPRRILYHTLAKAMFPDSPYGFSAGGVPEKIPTLTNKQFTEFHKNHYHPSNSYIMLYGDGNTKEELQFIHSNYLKDFSYVKPKSKMPHQKAFTKMKEVVSRYPIATSESASDKTFFALSFVVDDVDQPDLAMAFDVLAQILVNAQDAPIRQALLKAKIGKDIRASHSQDKQSTFTMVLQNANPEDRKAFKRIALNTLRKLVRNGLDKTMIEGAINRAEFALREADYGGFPKGLVHNMRTMQNWMFANDPFISLAYERPLARLKTALTTDYLEKIIERHLLQNNHAVLARVEPVPGLEQQIVADEKARLAKIKKTWSGAQIAQAIQATKDLKRFQARPDTPEQIASVPLLSLKDIDPRAQKLEVQKRSVQGLRVLALEEFSNNILYLQLLFDTTSVPQKLIGYVPVLAKVLGELNTKNKTYGDLEAQINIHTGGIETSVETFLEKDTGDYHPKLVVRSKAFQDKFAKLLTLNREILIQTLFDDEKRLGELLEQLNSRLQAMVRNNGTQLAMTRLESYFSNHGKYVEMVSGLSFAQFASDLLQLFETDPKQVISNLKTVASLVLNKKNLMVGITCDKQGYNHFSKQLQLLTSALPDREVKRQRYAFDFKVRNEGLTSASKVQYVAKGANFADLGYQLLGSAECVAPGAEPRLSSRKDPRPRRRVRCSGMVWKRGYRDFWILARSQFEQDAAKLRWLGKLSQNFQSL